jgi:hypothetical protein
MGFIGGNSVLSTSSIWGEKLAVNKNREREESKSGISVGAGSF